MPLSSLPVIILLVAVAAFVILRQFQDRPLHVPVLLGAPAGLLILGSGALAKEHRSATLDALLAADIALALVFGVWRGLSFHVWSDRTGERRRQGTRLTLMLWIVSIVGRAGMTAASRIAGGGKSAGYRELPFMLGLTLLAQAVVILWRAGQAEATTAVA